MSTLTYLKNFIRDKNVASITPTSAFGVKKVCDKIDFKKRNVIIEYGPGTGVFSKYLLKKMSKDSKLILIELNKNFVNILHRIRDPRVNIFNDSAENVLNSIESAEELCADYIISGIPFSFLTPNSKNRILHNTYQALGNGGKFLVYQHSNHLKEHLKSHFDVVRIEHEFRNIPPLCIYEAIKR
ncbi:MAG: methyltransferase [Proteobacteria bacterium]|nr:methyltransferase [Pseudomonadota bacterium]